MGYQMPAFRRGGVILCYAEWKDHCAIYPTSAIIARTFVRELAALDTDKGTSRFTPDKPLPATLVRKIVKARIAEIEAKPAAKKVGAKKIPVRSLSKR